MFPDDTTILREHGYNYYKHMHNNEVEPTEVEVSNTVEEIHSLREHYKAYVTEII